MNRKTLVLPAVVGLLAPVLAACGGSDSGADGGDADRRRHHRPVRRLQGRHPRPLDPAYAYDAGTWNMLRQTVQTLMYMPRGGGEPVPEAASELRLHRHRQRAATAAPCATA